jgi:prepilin-type N-terminal cleavage/methylation domain-containing protein
MLNERSTPRPDVRRTPRDGFTLVEVMVVLIVISLMVTMGIPSFSRTVENAKADIATANLRAVWAAGRVYWLENHTYTGMTLDELKTLNLLDPGVNASTTGPYSYTISVADGGASFTAVAERTGSAGWSGFFQIESHASAGSANDGIVTGSVSGGSAVITPSTMN